MTPDKNYYIIDAHCDTIERLWRCGGELADNELCLSLARLSGFGGYVQFFAAWIDDSSKTPLFDTLEMLDVFYRELNKNKEKMLQILTAEDMRKALTTNKIGALLTLENGNALEGSLANLRMLHRLGIRAVTLTWNSANELGDGITSKRGAGLSDFGKEVVGEMNRLGMMIDVSHLSVNGFWDVMKHSAVPVMASHSNAFSVTENKRNLSDEQIRAIVQTGGIIGLNLYPAFLSSGKQADLYDCLRHIEHMLSLGAENHLGLGSDFDGFSEPPPQGITGPQDYGNLFALLRREGYDPSFIEKLSHKNWLRFVEQVLASEMQK